MFTVSKSLEAAVLQNDLNEVRNALINYINVDPDNRTGDVGKAIRYAEEQGMDIWEPHDPSMPLNQDQAQWTAEYEANVTVDLHMNFSKERFAHWEAVAEVVGQRRQAERAQRQKAATHVEPHVTHTSNTYGGTSTSGGVDDELVKKVVIGVAAAAAVVAVAVIILK